jgi:hypothetical protein
MIAGNAFYNLTFLQAHVPVDHAQLDDHGTAAAHAGKPRRDHSASTCDGFDAVFWSNSVLRTRNTEDQSAPADSTQTRQSVQYVFMRNRAVLASVTTLTAPDQWPPLSSRVISRSSLCLPNNGCHPAKPSLRGSTVIPRAGCRAFPQLRLGRSALLCRLKTLLGPRIPEQAQAQGLRAAASKKDTSLRGRGRSHSKRGSNDGPWRGFETGPTWTLSNGGAIRPMYACLIGKVMTGLEECHGSRQCWSNLRNLGKSDHLDWHVQQHHITPTQRNRILNMTAGKPPNGDKRLWQDCFCFLYPEFSDVKGSLNPYTLPKSLLPDTPEHSAMSRAERSVMDGPGRIAQASRNDHSPTVGLQSMEPSIQIPWQNGRHPQQQTPRAMQLSHVSQGSYEHTPNPSLALQQSGPSQIQRSLDTLPTVFGSSRMWPVMGTATRNSPYDSHFTGHTPSAFPPVSPLPQSQHGWMQPGIRAARRPTLASSTSQTPTLADTNTVATDPSQLSPAPTTADGSSHADIPAGRVTFVVNDSLTGISSFHEPTQGEAQTDALEIDSDDSDSKLHDTFCDYEQWVAPARTAIDDLEQAMHRRGTSGPR